MSDVSELMKRCQRGVGGRNALDEAHAIMAECYGTLGRLESERAALEAENARLRQQLADVFEGNTKLHVLWTEAVRQRDKLAEALRRGVDHVTNARHDVEVRANAGNEAARLVLAGIDSWLINDARAAISELTP